SQHFARNHPAHLAFPTASNHGDTICGSQPKFLATQALPNSCGPWLTSLLAPSPRMMESCVWTRRPISNHARVWLRRFQLDWVNTFAWSTSRNVQEHCTGRAAFDTRTGKVYARTD